MLRKDIISSILKIPVIGIGAGNSVDGQVLVLHDMLGINQDFNPRFIRRYLNLKEEIILAVKTYIKDVKDIKWVFDPKIYDNKHVTYSYEILWKDGHKSLETKTLALGREGYLDIAFVKKVNEDTNFQKYADAAVEFANTVKFNEGYKHSDYKSGDKVAAVGIGGLVAGTLGVKALAKAGAFAKILPLLLKFGWILLIPLVFAGKLLGKKNQPRSSSDYWVQEIKH